MNKNIKAAIAILSIIIIVLSLSALAILPDMPSGGHVHQEQEETGLIKVAVLNGCGRSGLAAVFAEKLRTMGFDVVNGLGENADSFNYEESIVLDRRGIRKNAEIVAEALKIDTILEQRTDDPYLIEDIIVILGRDWDTLNISREDFVD